MSTDERISLVTGASRGIGKQVAIGLARQGHTVAIVCRDPAQGRATAGEIAATTGNPRIHSLPADLSSQKAVRQLAASVLERFPALHVLVNNAGAIHRRHEMTEDGIEKTFAVNHLASFLLTSLLSDLLRRSAPSRVINVVSVTYKYARLDLDTIANPRRYSAARAYAESKLANVLCTRELARRLGKSGVAVAAVHPGAVRTNIYSSTPVNRIFRMLYGWRFLPAAEGAKPIVELAVSTPVEEMSGRYFDRYTVQEPAEHARDRARAEQLWKLCEDLTSPSRQGDSQKRTTMRQNP